MAPATAVQLNVTGESTVAPSAGESSDGGDGRAVRSAATVTRGRAEALLLPAFGSFDAGVDGGGVGDRAGLRRRGR